MEEANDDDVERIKESLINPSKLYSFEDAPSEVPKESGICAWFFKEIPPKTPTDRCITRDGLTLLHVGICPKDDKGNPKKRHLHYRICKEHYGNNVTNSTLRQSIAVLLMNKNPSLRPIRAGSINNKKFNLTSSGKEFLSKWMEANAFVCWVTHPRPWDVKKGIIKSTTLPLNIIGREDDPFAKDLKAMRRKARWIAWGEDE